MSEEFIDAKEQLQDWIDAKPERCLARYRNVEVNVLRTVTAYTQTFMDVGQKKEESFDFVIADQGSDIAEGESIDIKDRRGNWKQYNIAEPRETSGGYICKAAAGRRVIE